MKKVLKYSILSFVLSFCLLSVTGCGNEDDEPKSGSSTFTINGEKAKINLLTYAICEDSYSRQIFFSINLFKYDNDDHTFSIYLPSSLENIKSGETFDADEITVSYFYPSTSIYIGHLEYWPVSGKVKVQSVTSTNITLKFSNFTFVRESTSYTSDNWREETFTVDGSITYKIRD